MGDRRARDTRGQVVYEEYISGSPPPPHRHGGGRRRSPSPQRGRQKHHHHHHHHNDVIINERNGVIINERRYNSHERRYDDTNGRRYDSYDRHFETQERSKNRPKTSYSPHRYNEPNGTVVRVTTLKSGSRVMRDNSPSKKDANRTNLHVWGQWRKEVNETLISDVIDTNTRKKRVTPLETKIKDGGVYDYNSKNDQTRGLMNYSLSTNRVTDLEPNDFLRYGIPRAKVNSANKNYRSLWQNGEGAEENGDIIESSAPMTNGHHSYDTTDWAHDTMQSGNRSNGFSHDNPRRDDRPIRKNHPRNNDRAMTNGYSNGYDRNRSNSQNYVNPTTQGKLTRGQATAATPRTDYSMNSSSQSRSNERNDTKADITANTYASLPHRSMEDSRGGGADSYFSAKQQSRSSVPPAPPPPPPPPPPPLPPLPASAIPLPPP